MATVQGEHELCRVCGRAVADSKEHIPPKSAKNAGPVEVRFILGSDDTQHPIARVLRSGEGFWLPSLCEDCNNVTGSRYGAAYAHFVGELAATAGIRDPSGRIVTRLQDLYPLRVLKQMFCMFLAASPFQPAAQWSGIQKFVLKRDAKLPEDAPSVLLYLNSSRVGRITPLCGIVESATHLHHVAAEISWPPIGIVFSFGEHPRVEQMQDITSWAQFGFHESVSVDLTLPELHVSTSYPLAFGTSEQVEREQVERMMFYLYHVPDGYQGPVGLGAELRPLPPN